jgi:hypothetical protein
MRLLTWDAVCFGEPVALGGTTRNIVINGCCELLKAHKPPRFSGSTPAADMIAMWLHVVRVFMG